MHDARTPHALREVFVRCADDHALDARIGGRDRCCCCQRIVGFEFDHRPYGDSGGDQRFLERPELREKTRFDPFARLVSGP